MGRVALVFGALLVACGSGAPVDPPIAPRPAASDLGRAPADPPATAASAATGPSPAGASPQAAPTVPLPTAPSAPPDRGALAGACSDATRSERWDNALAACRESYWSLIGRGAVDLEGAALESARMPAYLGLARVAEARGQPEQAMHFYRQALRASEDPTVRARLDALSIREVRSSLRRPVFPDVMFQLGSSLITGEVLHERAGALDDVGRAGATARYESRAIDTEHDLEVGVVVVEDAAGVELHVRMRHGETWYGLGHVAGGEHRNGPRIIESLELIELVGGGPPEVRLVVSDRRAHPADEDSCVFVQDDNRILSLFGLHEAAGAVRYAQILITRSERQEASIVCRTEPARVPPTFRWSVEPVFDPAAGTIELRPTAGEFPDEVLGPIPIDDLHCRWGSAWSAWPCPRR